MHKTLFSWTAIFPRSMMVKWSTCCTNWLWVTFWFNSYKWTLFLFIISALTRVSWQVRSHKWVPHYNFQLAQLRIRSKWMSERVSDRPFQAPVSKMHLLGYKASRIMRLPIHRPKNIPLHSVFGIFWHCIQQQLDTACYSRLVSYTAVRNRKRHRTCQDSNLESSAP